MNSDVIRLLPDSVANQIAAGEVIQRPASVIKELVENSIDAGATAITIVLKDAGRTLIQVIDNGCGMSATDARMAFERHATSKIAAATDLYTLHTMGFRGEALPSIAAVAQIDLRTMRHGQSIGTRLQIAESRFESQEPVSCMPGSNIMVKNIFFHMPARRKFLKKDSIELSHIIHEFERLALVNTSVEFTLVHNDVTLHQFSGGSLKQRIGALFGKNIESQLAPIATETSLVKISGFIGMPRFAKKRGSQQFLFVNGRNMRHPFFHKAILRCYEQLIAPDVQPSYFINFEVDPSTIDVNIHPQKHEIKFEHEAAIWQILEAAVRETLGRTQAAGALDFDGDAAPEIPLFDPLREVNAMPQENFDESFNPFAMSDGGSAPSAMASHASSGGGASWQGRTCGVPRDWDKLYENFSRRRDEALSGQPVAPDALTPSEGDFTIRPAASEQAPCRCFQYGGRYIVSGSHRGIMVISARRAHIRILYERFMEQMADGADMPSQALIFPEDFETSAANSTVIESILPQLATAGFALKQNDATHWSILGVPAAISAGKNATEILLALVDDVPADILDRDVLRSPMALSMARAAAIKTSQTLTAGEMEAIIADLFRCSEPSFTPEGLPVLSIIDNDELDRRFNV